jgi:hypothetical protein
MNNMMLTKADHMFAALNVLMHRRDQIQTALDRQSGEGFTFDHVFDMISQGRAFFFWNESSCAIVEGRTYPGENTMHIFLAAGTTDGLLRLYDVVAEWGKKEFGITKMTTLCRKGFKRTLAKHGWKQPQVWLVKEIV